MGKWLKKQYNQNHLAFYYKKKKCCDAIVFNTGF